MPTDAAEMLVVQHLRACLLGIDFEKTAQMVADKVTNEIPSKWEKPAGRLAGWINEAQLF